ncbi:MAG: glycosyltransferase family 39 protein [Bacteroidetes bacterium]|nr:glycosyltransferase family 39 protein [Bacteroidota bacterium]
MKDLIQTFKNKYSPLQQILLIGLFVRLLSVIFSKGFGWHDDHFLIIEPAQSWVDGEDANYWLPSATDPSRQPQGHPLVYTGLHYLILSFFKIVGLNNPQAKMFFIRLLHALWSLFIIKYSYKITEKLHNAKSAWYVGLFMALYWFMPFMSVRNLVEFVCVPLILIGIWNLMKEDKALKNFIIAGILFAIAMAVRYQVIFLLAGIGVGMLINKDSFKQCVTLILSFLFVFFLSEGVRDYFLWHKPFAEFMAYIQYNLDNATVYGTDNWHMYFDLVFGLLVPPLSFLLFAGYFVSWKKTSLLFWPVLFYFAFHTYFPNKQERFIMTILPLIIICGTIGMFMIYEKRKEKINQKLFKVCKTFVIVLNLILLPVLTLSYSKRHRVEAMTYLYHQKDHQAFIVEDSNKDSEFLIPPLYYCGKWFSVLGVTKVFTPDSVLRYFNRQEKSTRPNYVVFMQAENLNARVDSMKKRFPSLIYETTIEPSFIDKTLFFLNPMNDNQTVFIYKLK